MLRLWIHVVAGVLGLVLGGVLALVAAPTATVADPPVPPAALDTATPVPTTGPTPTPESSATAGARSDPAEVATAQVLLAWTPGRLPDGLAAAADEVPGVNATTIVSATRLDLRGSVDADGRVVDDLAPGWAIPLDAIAIDPATYTPFVPGSQRAVLDELRPGTVLLGATSAGLRGVGVGATLRIDDRELTVAGVVDDVVIGAAEVVLHVDDPAVAAAVPRYVLLRHGGDRVEVEASLRRVAGATPVRVRAPGETPYLRHGDAVLPQALVKARFGEFRYRPPTADGRAVTIDPSWMAENLVTREVALLGRVTCNRAVVAQLDAALRQLDREGLGFAVDPDGFAGCWNPRLISPGGALSRHTWGIAVDLNATGNATGLGSGQHPALVEALTSRGWGWGGTWLVPDPMHFEAVDDEPLTSLKLRP